MQEHEWLTNWHTCNSRYKLREGPFFLASEIVIWLSSSLKKAFMDDDDVKPLRF